MKNPIIIGGLCFALVLMGAYLGIRELGYQRREAERKLSGSTGTCRCRPAPPDLSPAMTEHLRGLGHVAGTNGITQTDPSFRFAVTFSYERDGQVVARSTKYLHVRARDCFDSHYTNGALTAEITKLDK